MKATRKCFTVVLAVGFSLGTLTARADLEVSARVRIHAAADSCVSLASSGIWIEAGAYGRCWRPAGVAAGWRQP